MVVRTFASAPPPPRGHRRGWLVAFAAFVALLIAGLGVLVALWSGATLSPDRSALAKVSLQPFAGSLVRATAFGPDGLRIVTGSRDKTARVWDARPVTSSFAESAPTPR